MIGRKEVGSPSEVKPNLHPTIFSFLPLICIILLFGLLHMALRKEGQLLVVKTVIIIRSKFFFLFIGREPTTWPANNCLQIMVCPCAMLSNCWQLAANNILHMHKGNRAFLLLAIALAWKWQIASLQEDISLKKQTRWSNDKTIIIELRYRKIIVICQCLTDQIASAFTFGKQLICSPQTNHDILLNLVQ